MPAHAYGHRLFPCAVRKRRRVKRPTEERPKSCLPPWQVLAVGARNGAPTRAMAAETGLAAEPAPRPRLPYSR